MSTPIAYILWQTKAIKSKSKPAAPKTNSANTKGSKPKKKAGKAVLKEIHNNGSDIDNDEMDVDHEPFTNKHTLDEDDNTLPVPNKGKTAHEKYQVVSQRIESLIVFCLT